MKLKRITLAFENCDVADIPAEYVTYMLISGVTTTQIYTGAGDVESMLECNDCEIHILKEAAELKLEFDCFEEFEDMNLGKRLMYRDIVGVDLDYGNRIDSYCVNWADGNEFVNENMSVADEGNEIRISIG